MPGSPMRRGAIVLTGLVLVVAGALALHQRNAPAPPETAPVPTAEVAPPPATPGPVPRHADAIPHARAATPAPVPVPAAAAAASAPAPATTMARIRDLVRSDPDQALALLDAADRAHRDDSLAEERAALRVDVLVSARRIGVARDAAEEFLSRYPSSPRAQHIEMLTGVHPHPPEP